jgi:hypothetical protein
VADRDWQGELGEALRLASEDEGRAVAIEHRLSRIEALLMADLDKLGDAVLGATVARIDARLAVLADRIDALIERLDPPASSERPELPRRR